MVLCSVHQSLDSPNFSRGAIFFRSIFKLVFLSHYKFKFLHHELTVRKNSCRVVSRWKTVAFVGCIRALKVEKLPKCHLSRHFLNHQDHFLLSSITTVFISSIKVLMNNFLAANLISNIIFHFVPCIGIQTFQVLLFIVFHLDIETLNSP